MAQASNPHGKKKFAVIPLIVIAVAALVIIGAGGFVFAASQESHDSFCASCHTQPETTFFQRSTAGQPTDLASFHTAQKTNCIDCHSGQGIAGRVQAELLGARNAFKWYTGTAVQPAVLFYPIGDQNCLKCHQNVTARGFSPVEQITVPGGRSGEGEEEGRNNHWHEFLTRWQAASASAGSCTSCHAGHAADTTSQDGFMNQQAVQATCEACHQVLRHGEGG
jgi:nitrate/TMAO reductase-like tetraheme cytochrome c subunit